LAGFSRTAALEVIALQREGFVSAGLEVSAVQVNMPSRQEAE